MKQSARHLFLLSALFLAGLAASAQTDSSLDAPDLSSAAPGTGKHGRAMENKARMDSLKTALQLSPAQSAGMDSVNLEFRTRIAQLKAEGGDNLSRFKQARMLKENREAGLKGILSADQYARLKKYEAERKEERKAMRTAGQ